MVGMTETPGPIFALANLQRPVDRVAVSHSDPLFDQMASPESVFGKVCPPYHWRFGIGRGGSPAWARLATAVAAITTLPFGQGRRNRNHRGSNRRGAEGVESNKRHDGLHSPPQPPWYQIINVNCDPAGNWPPAGVVRCRHDDASLAVQRLGLRSGFLNLIRGCPLRRFHEPVPAFERDLCFRVPATLILFISLGSFCQNSSTRFHPLCPFAGQRSPTPKRNKHITIVLFV
jgi:hypothetical protein